MRGAQKPKHKKNKTPPLPARRNVPPAVRQIHPPAAAGDAGKDEAPLNSITLKNFRLQAIRAQSSRRLVIIVEDGNHVAKGSLALAAHARLAQHAVKNVLSIFVPAVRTQHPPELQLFLPLFLVHDAACDSALGLQLRNC
jgi:hypothetical protein